VYWRYLAVGRYNERYRTGTRSSNKDIIQAAVGFELDNHVRIPVVPGYASPVSTGDSPGIMKYQTFDRTARQPGKHSYLIRAWF